MSDKCVIVSAVRDFDMYRRCVSDNPHNRGLSFIAADNRTRNEHIATLYNRLLDEFDYSSPTWIIFCHEDFEFLESIAEKVCALDVGAIYGPIGGRLLCRRRWMLGGMWPGEYVGSVLQSEKDGSRQVVIGSVAPTGTIADALDCQCLIVHSSLIQTHRLRFDEHLSFDLYAEDFCLGAMVEYGIATRILSIKCHHYSYGKLLPRFFEQKEYLDAKYPNEEAFSPVGQTIGGGRTALRRFQKRVRKVMDKRCPWLASLIIELFG